MKREKSEKPNMTAAMTADKTNETLKTKRLNIASKAIAAATQLYDAVITLDQLRQERAQAGNYVDTDPQADPPVVGDFDRSDLSHLTAYDIGNLLDNVVPAIKAVVDQAGNKNQLLKVRQ